MCNLINTHTHKAREAREAREDTPKACQIRASKLAQPLWRGHDERFHQENQPTKLGRSVWTTLQPSAGCAVHELVDNLAAFATLVFSSRVFPQVSWTLHTSANLSALGQNTRPVACDNVLRRVTGTNFCHRYGRKLADYFQPWGQYGVGVSGGVKTMALTVALGSEEICTILSYDGAYSFNGIYRH